MRRRRPDPAVEVRGWGSRVAKAAHIPKQRSAGDASIAKARTNVERSDEGADESGGAAIR